MYTTTSKGVEARLRGPVNLPGDLTLPRAHTPECNPSTTLLGRQGIQSNLPAETPHSMPNRASLRTIRVETYCRNPLSSGSVPAGITLGHPGVSRRWGCFPPPQTGNAPPSTPSASLRWGGWSFFYSALGLVVLLGALLGLHYFYSFPIKQGRSSAGNVMAGRKAIHQPLGASRRPQ